MNVLRDIAGLFFPRVCAACGRPLDDGQELLCNRCRWDIPLTRYWERPDNPLAERLRAHFPIENAAAFYFFTHDSPFRTLIHDFKYRGRWSVAHKMGRWFGAEIAPYYADIDIVIPVPLHLLKRLRRGYNQSEHIARGIALALGPRAAIDTHVAIRKYHTRSQSTRTPAQRWDNVEGIFRVRRPRTLAGKHVLLVDDVLTTGATILSLAQTILCASPSTRISIATLATTKNISEV